MNRKRLNLQLIFVLNNSDFTKGDILFKFANY